MELVSIHGEGIAARCCAHLLRAGGVAVSTLPVGRPQVPVIMLSDAAVGLIRDAFGRQDLLQTLPRITKRFVLWGAEASPLVLPHAAGVVSEEGLLQGLGPAGDESEGAGAWTVYSSRPLPERSFQQSFGDRMATATAVTLREGSAENACWIEALPGGWLFLITSSPGHAWLLSVGGGAEGMLGQSRMVGDNVARLGPETNSFPCAPRMLVPVAGVPVDGAGWLVCGSAAMGFDPLCGDGTAHAVREAILASAVIRAIRSGGDQTALLRHYEGRLRAGFRKHLEMCLRFYETGPEGPWWQEQAAAVREGILWCDAQGTGGTSYRLRGFDLEPIG